MTDEAANVHRACLSLAAVASAAAGLVHAAAWWTHAGDRTLAVLFAVCAVAQVTWAAIAACTPRGRWRRPAWRSTGWPWGPGSPPAPPACR